MDREAWQAAVHGMQRVGHNQAHTHTHKVETHTKQITRPNGFAK